MNIGETIRINGVEYVLKAKNDSLDYCGNPETEYELEASDGSKKWLPEWLCEEIHAKDNAELSLPE